MKFKIIFVFMTAVAFLLVGRSDRYLAGNLEPGIAYAQVKQLDEETEKAREEKKIFPLEPQKEEIKGKEKIQLPGQMPAISPETFRMIETIENKNRELKNGKRHYASRKFAWRRWKPKSEKTWIKLRKAFSNRKSKWEFKTKRTRKMWRR